jgi:hypothetical protein
MIVEHRLTEAGSNQGPPQAASEASRWAALTRAAPCRPENGPARGDNPDRIVRAGGGMRAHIPFSNRKIQLLESRPTHCKQTTATISNRQSDEDWRPEGSIATEGPLFALLLATVSLYPQLPFE